MYRLKIRRNICLVVILFVVIGGVWHFYNLDIRKTGLLENPCTFLISEDRFNVLQSEGMQLDSAMILWDTDGKPYKLKKLVNSHKLIVLRYSELNCNVCVDTLFSRIKHCVTEINKNNILVLASYHNKRDLLIFKRINQLPYLILSVDSLQIPLDNLNEPYLFVLHEDMRMTHFFIPHKERSNDTDRYMKFVQKYIECGK